MKPAVGGALPLAHLSHLTSPLLPLPLPQVRVWSWSPLRLVAMHLCHHTPLALAMDPWGAELIVTYVDSVKVYRWGGGGGSWLELLMYLGGGGCTTYIPYLRGRHAVIYQSSHWHQGCIQPIDGCGS
jgi:hypothetical protein